MPASSPDLEILGVGIDNLPISDTIERCQESIAASRPLRLTQINVEMCWAAANDEKIARLLNSADLKLPNGSGLQWAARYDSLDRPDLLNWFTSLGAMLIRPSLNSSVIKERYTSTSFTLPLLTALDQAGEAKILLAGHPKAKSIEHTADHLSREFSNLEFTTFDTDQFNQTQLEKLQNQVAEQEPDVTLLAIGFPQQETAAAHLRQQAKRGVFIGEGGSFDYREFGGQIHRAPRTLQTLHLEWLWRLAREPSRWRRQLALPRFAWRVYRSRQNQD